MKGTVFNDMVEQTLNRVRKYLIAMRDYLRTKKMAAESPARYECGYYIKSAKDERCCEFCKQIENHYFKSSEAELGITYPPFDVCESDFCRCYATFELKKKEKS